jgi:hypothetical protein
MIGSAGSLFDVPGRTCESHSSVCVLGLHPACMMFACRHVVINAGSAEAMNYAGFFSNCLGSNTFTDVLPPAGTQVLCPCLVLGFRSRVFGLWLRP